MNLTKTYKQDGVSITVSNTMRQDLRFRTAMDLFEVGENVDAEFRAIFLWVTSYTTDVKGIDWKPVEVITAESLETSYEGFLGAISQEVGRKWHDLIMELKKPWANTIEKPDHTLTPEEQADPN